MTEKLPPKRRLISQFMAQELLYDYANGLLDPVRQQAVEKALKEYPELRNDLDFLKSANEYCEKLSSTSINDELLESFSQIQSLSKTVKSSFQWRHWPETLKWATEALILSAIVFAFTLVTPWKDIKVWLETDSSPVATEERLLEKNIERATEKEVVVSSGTEPTKESQATAPTQEIVEEEKVKKVVELRGSLHRISMKISNIESRADEVKELILSMGGKKAGRVRLGWRKANGNYYHFSLPQKNMEEFSSTLGEYGPVRLSKHAHPRVMPAGKVRIILFIEDGPIIKEEAVPEAPGNEQDKAKKET